MSRSKGRSQKLVDLRQQGFFALMMVLYFSIFVAFFSYLTLVFGLEGSGHQHRLIDPDVLGEMFAFALRYWIQILITLVSMSLCAILFSHRVFGPMRQFERVLRRKAGQPEEPVKCRLRRGDFFQEFARLLEDVLNQSAADRLSEQ